MGKKKKSSSQPQKRPKATLATTFTCLFCNHEKSVVCTMDKKGGVGNLNCKVCGQTFQAPIHALSAPIDVYSEWIDACEAVQTNKPAAAPKPTSDRPAQEEEPEQLSDLDEGEFD